MARKGSQHRNGADHHASKHNSTVPESVHISSSEKREKFQTEEGKIFGTEELPNGNLNGRPRSPLGKSVKKNKSSGNGKKNTHRNGNASVREKSEEKTSHYSKSESISNKLRDMNHFPTSSESREDKEMTFGDDRSSEKSSSSIPSGLTVESVMDGLSSSDAVAGRNFRDIALHVMKAGKGWVERQKPHISAFTTVIYNARDYVCIKIKIAYPIIRTWILQFSKIVFLLSMVWLDCSLRGLTSLLHLGTTSLFAVIWCSFFSLLAMIGITKMLLIMVTAGLVAIFIGLALGIAIIAISATIILGMYGSFWITGLVLIAGGLAFALRHERAALFLTSVYSAYCAKCYVGWLGLVLGLNLSFISSDVLINFLRNNMSDQRFNIPPEQETQSHTRAGHFYSEPMRNPSGDGAFQSSFGKFTDRNAGDASTSGAEVELTSEDEVFRLLSCNDHYSALGFARFENIDASSLKREYRKKAMLVHPDKNMGNEKAAEAFKKLQNAYEVLLDSLKRKTYDDELRREEILNYFRRFQSLSQKNGRHGAFTPGFSHGEGVDEGPHGESRRIACKKCNDFHIWTCTNRSKSRARWCQDCKDSHQAKDGDGWVEHSSQPLMFGLLQKMDPPHAYVCAESKIYDATEWFVCQGMRCPANTHKPSFHVNTSLTSKHNTKGTGSSNGGNGGVPMPNMEEAMTEEEFVEWLQNAMQSGMFEANMSNESPSTKTGSFSKSTSGKKKRKGKKQW